MIIKYIYNNSGFIKPDFSQKKFMLDGSGNYRRRNLRGRSFKNQDLTNEDFSYADIRGADFTNANLTGTKFNYVIAGLTKFWIAIFFILVVILSITSGIAAFVASYIPIRFIVPSPNEPIPIYIGVVIFVLLEFVNVGLLVTTIHQGIQKTLGYLFPVIPLMMLLLPILTILAMSENNLLKWLNFFGITDTPPRKLIDFSEWLKAFRIGNIIQGITNLLTDSDSVNIAVNIIVSLIVSVGAILVLITTLSIAVILAKIIAEKSQADSVVAWSRIFTIIITGLVVKNIDDHYEIFIFRTEPLKGVVLGIATYIIAIAISILLISITGYLAKKILAEDQNNIIIRRIAVAIGAVGGTSFRNANLRDTNFSYASLKSTDFRLANVTRTLWRKAKYLTFARVETTILIDPKVRELLVTGNGKNQQYISVNLRGANLRNADLSQSNLKIAELSEAALEGACLDGANLSEVLAVGANFTDAKMTATCLESWNINHTTILDHVESKYVYLLAEAKPGTDDRERRPSSGYFAPGDFTKLFGEILNTVDLIFRNGIDAQAFMCSFKQVKVENEGIPMKIQSIENKGDGVVVIKISVPPEASKGKIHQELTQFYQENVKLLAEKYQEKFVIQEEKVFIYRQHSQYMMSLVYQILVGQNQVNLPSILPKFFGISQPSFADALAELKIAIEAEAWLTPEDKEEALKQVNILAKVGKNSLEENYNLANSAMNILREIVGKHPAAEWMAVAFKNVLQQLV